MTPLYLFDLWKLLHKAAVHDDRTVFTAIQREIASRYKKLDNAQQGEYHRLVAEWYSEDKVEHDDDS